MYARKALGDIEAKAVDYGMDHTTVGNLAMFCPEPPENQASSSKKRSSEEPLTFDAAFEAGNLGRVDHVSEDEYDLFVRPDTSSPAHRLWFHFVVHGGAPRQKLLLNLINLSKQKSLFSDSMTPVVKRGAKRKWERLEPSDVRYWKSPLHDGRPILSLAFAFDASEPVQFAYNFPYSFASICSHLGRSNARNLPFLRIDPIGNSLQGRRLDMLTITRLDNLNMGTKQQIVFVTARVHPGESPASFVCQGLIDFLLSSDPRAERLRERYVWKIIPCLNPDGVALGNYRCSLMGFDLNRHWQTPSAWAHPTVAAAKRTLLQYNRNAHMDMVLYVDLHAHSTRLGAFMYGNCFAKDERKCERQLALPFLFAEEAEDFSLDSTNLNTDNYKSGTGRRAMGGSLATSCLCYTLEVSFAGYKSNRRGPKAPFVPYTAQLYQRIGENLARAVLRFSAVEAGEEPPPVPPRPIGSFLTFAAEGKARKASKATFRVRAPPTGKSARGEE